MPGRQHKARRRSTRKHKPRDAKHTNGSVGNGVDGGRKHLRPSRSVGSLQGAAEADEAQGARGEEARSGSRSARLGASGDERDLLSLSMMSIGTAAQSKEDLLKRIERLR